MTRDGAAIDRSTASAMSGILISRVFGFLREMAIASVFGLSPQVDAFVAAYRIPNFFRTLLGEGSLSAAFVPVLAETVERDGQGAAVDLTRAFFSILLVASGGLCLAGMALAPSILTVAAPGFPPAVHRLAVDLLRILFPFFVFLILGAWAMGILHVRGRFFLPAVAPVCLSGAQIAFLLLLGARFAPEPVRALAWGVVLGGALQFLVQVPALLREGFRLRPIWRPRLAAIRRVGVLFLPVVVALGVNQVNSLVDTFLSSFLARGSLASLGYATRLYTLPLSLFGVSIAMVALPTLSRESTVEGGTGAGHVDRVRQWWLRSLFLLVPSALFLAFFAGEIVSLVFQRGAFGPEAVGRVSGVLRLYAIGLPAFGSVKILASGFHALQDTRTPMRKAILATAVNIGLSILLMRVLEVRGIALATSIAALLHVSILAAALHRRSGATLLTRPVLGVIARIAAAGLIALLAAWALRGLWPGDVAAGGIVDRCMRLFPPAGGGVLVYFVAAGRLGAGRLSRGADSRP